MSDPMLTFLSSGQISTFTPWVRIIHPATSFSSILLLPSLSALTLLSLGKYFSLADLIVPAIPFVCSAALTPRTERMEARLARVSISRRWPKRSAAAPAVEEDEPQAVLAGTNIAEEGEPEE